MNITIEQLKGICPLTSSKILEKYVEPLNTTLPLYGIDTVLRIRHFLAQVAHESGCFNYVRELASGSAYEGRKDLGNVNVGDGKKFKGRGLIQVTGRGNYAKCSLALFNDSYTLVENPTLLEQPQNAVKSACWFWRSNNLSKLADKDDIKGITKRINGGYNGLTDRIAKYEKAKKYIV